MSTADEARAEAARQYPETGYNEAGFTMTMHEAFIAGAEWQASRKVEAAPDQYADAAYAHWREGRPEPTAQEAFEVGHSIGWGAGYEVGATDRKPEAAPSDTDREALVKELRFLPEFVQGTHNGKPLPLADFTRDRIAKALTEAADEFDQCQCVQADEWGNQVQAQECPHHGDSTARYVGDHVVARLRSRAAIVSAPSRPEATQQCLAGHSASVEGCSECPYVFGTPEQPEGEDK